jgi:hypothetical protein
MPEWVTPPTFADGNYLLATDLNKLSNNVEHLYAKAHQVNTGCLLIDFNPGSGVTETKTPYAYRHFSNTFRYRAEVNVGTFDALVIKYKASGGSTTTVLNDGGTNPSAPYVWTGTVDISSMGFTVGDYYEIQIEATGQTGSSTNALQVFYVGEDF